MAQVRAFNQARHVRDDEAAEIVHLDDAQVRFKSGERIVGNLGAGSRDTRNQRGFAGVRKADESDVSEKFEFETEIFFLARPAWFVLGRGLVS
jgi:hypothetical protein